VSLERPDDGLDREFEQGKVEEGESVKGARGVFSTEVDSVPLEEVALKAI